MQGKTDEDLPRQWYVEPDAYVGERKAIFAEAWQMLGRVDQLSQPGSYLCANLAGLAVFATCDAAGTIHALRNVCRHQGMPVLENGAGSCERLRCRYHGWTYDLSGAFVTAPPVVAPADAGAPEHHLERVGQAAWRGLLFVHPDLRAAAPAARLDDALGEIAPDRLQAAGEVTTELDCNWKVAVEQRLAEAPDLRWAWPTLIAESAPDRLLVDRVVPRSFRRTQLIRHIFLPPGHDAAAVLDRATAAAEALKAACDAAQAAYAAGTIPQKLPDRAALKAFRVRIREAHRAAAAAG
ncbi:MAG TPA: Rieske (2Fe-2S) protein [Stellaceae bacterium]|nr:Rieske (2Fe-2S) protein [Stellaceae bacterium]